VIDLLRLFQSCKMITAMNTPWQPIYSVERSGVPDVTIFGTVCVVEGEGKGRPAKTVLALGDIDSLLWTRSLLKPWQLLSHLELLKRCYPGLEPEHIAIMMASHSGEAVHQRLLGEIMEIGGVSQSMLKCPASYPLAAQARKKAKEEGSPSPLFHNCSGKHLGYLLAIKAVGGDLDQYLNFNGQHFQPLIGTICSLLGRRDDSLPVTTDGCQLPNYAVTACELATLYLQLANPELISQSHQPEIHEGLAHYPELSPLMVRYPVIIGGTDRLDTKIMSGGLSVKHSPLMVAKEGADGLLAIGVGATPAYPNGLGILIKVASGFDTRQMELIASEVLARLGLGEHPDGVPSQPQGARTDHLRVDFHFQAGCLAAV
jgi:L-asparaginase II